MLNLLVYVAIILSFGFSAAHSDSEKSNDYYNVEFNPDSIRFSQSHNSPVTSKIKYSKFSFAQSGELKQYFKSLFRIYTSQLKSLDSFDSSNFILSGAHIAVNLSLSSYPV
jgi:hypothetical protein